MRQRGTKVKVSASELFTDKAREEIRKAIDKNEGGEVSFVGYIDRSGLVTEIEAMAYGNEEATPVVIMDVLQGDVLIHNHPGSPDDEDLLRASEADIGVATELANNKIGFYIIDNECTIANIIFKPVARVYLKNEEVENIFADDGILSQVIPNFEAREEQQNLVHGIVETINDSKLLISEAGTGTGKSLSYLIPASIWALQNKKRVIVSTQTINLQQQIAGKDMQIVERVLSSYLNTEIHYSVLIGKGNYLCRKKLHELIRDQEKKESLFSDEDDHKVLFEIEDWSQSCQDGTYGEYGGFVKDEIWEEVACDSVGCSRRKCLFYGDCFYYKARLQAEKSNIIIGNHSLVFSSIDEESHRSSLPHFAGVVFDEAHHIEDVALKSLSQDFSIQSLIYQLRKLYTSRGDRATGLLVLLERKTNFKGYVELAEEYNGLVKMVRELLRELTEFILDGSGILKRFTVETNSIGLDEKFMESDEFTQITDTVSRLFVKINRFTSSFINFSARVKEIATKKEVIDIINSIGYRLESLSRSKEVFDLIFNTENEINFVKWIEVTKKNIKFNYSPLEVGDFLASSLFSRKEFTVFTSATLMINGKFDYFKGSTGVSFTNNKEKLEMDYPSPFDYSRQAEIYILEEQVDHGSVTKEKTDLVRELSMMSEGGVLALFTSYYRLTEMYGLLKDELAREGLMPLKQGEASRDELLGRMAKHPNVVLFATSSFWEGIDIQGDNLRCVIIEKLPFDSPGDPIYKAKVELLDSKGINSFMNYSIPRAVLRLKQGIGRLIRSKTDKGVIAIMDNRVHTKRYGKIILNSLPPAKLITGSLRTIVREAENFFVSRF